MSDYFDNKNTFLAPNVSQHGAHMVMTNVMKPTKIKYLNLDTKFCDEYVNNRTNPTNPNYNLASYTFTLPERITDVKSMKVENIQIPMTFYNISAALDNNYFSVSWSSTATYNASITFYTNSIIIVIPDGVYDAVGISTAINTQLTNNTTLNAKLTYVQNGNMSNFYAATGTNNLQFKIDFAVSTSGCFDKFNVKSKLGWILGYRNITYTINPNCGQSAGSVSEAYINMFTNKYFYLAIDEYSNGNQNSFISPLAMSLINKNIVAKIALDYRNYPYGSLFTASVNFGYIMSDSRNYSNGGKVDIQRLGMQLLTENGAPVNLNGSDFAVGIKMEYE